MAKKKTPYKLDYDIDVDQLLLQSRIRLLYGCIDTPAAQKLCEELIALSLVSKKPIVLRINSNGGYVEKGISIVDTILGLSCPVHTVICGEASSIAALIFLAGKRRFMTENSCFMLHELITADNLGNEYANKVKARLKYYQDVRWNIMESFIKSRTRLSNEDMKKAETEELWVWADTAIQKGVAHQIIKG